MVAKLQQKQCDITYLGVVVRSIQELVLNCEQIVVKFVKREANSCLVGLISWQEGLD